MGKQQDIDDDVWVTKWRLLGTLIPIPLHVVPRSVQQRAERLRRPQLGRLPAGPADRPTPLSHLDVLWRDGFAFLSQLPTRTTSGSPKENNCSLSVHLESWPIDNGAGLLLILWLCVYLAAVFKLIFTSRSKTSKPLLTSFFII